MSFRIKPPNKNIQITQNNKNIVEKDNNPINSVNNNLAELKIDNKKTTKNNGLSIRPTNSSADYF
jgi:hypothetical protein